MADLTLNDLFPGSSLDAQWTTHGSPTVTIASGDCTLNDQAGGFLSTNTFDFTGKRLAWKIKGTKPNYFFVCIGTSGMLAPMMQWASGGWICGISVFAMPGYKTNYGNSASADSSEWAAMEHDGAGNIEYSTSADSTNGADGTWTVHHTAANAADFTASKVSFILDTDGGAAVDFVIDRIGVSGGAPATRKRRQVVSAFRAKPVFKPRGVSLFQGPTRIPAPVTAARVPKPVVQFARKLTPTPTQRAKKYVMIVRRPRFMTGTPIPPAANIPKHKFWWFRRRHR